MDITLKVQYHEVVMVITDRIMKIRNLTSPEDYSKIHVQANYVGEVRTLPSFSHFIVSFPEETHPSFYFNPRQTVDLVLEYVQRAHEYLRGLNFKYSFALVPVPEGRLGERSFSHDYQLGYLELTTEKIPFLISDGE